MYQPLSTYRIQFHKDFTLARLEAIIPYLVRLGVQTLYASPIFEAVPGSTHGYDGTNPLRINPEIGTEAELRHCASLLRAHGIGWLQDIVPNHMAFHIGNPWLMDVLRKGPDSQFASFFDIDWNSDIGKGKLMVPFLGATADEEIEAGNLKLAYAHGEPVFQYFDTQYPLNTVTQNKLLLRVGPHSLSAIDKMITELNDDKELMQEMVSQQYYQLCRWQDTDRHINYRRFFTINGLICLNVQNRRVFDQYHVYIRQLVGDDVFTGLRIDHIDGLYEPAAYLNNLQNSMGGDVYTVVEKILQPGETLPQSWQAQGTTGYDFLAMINNLFTNPANEGSFNRFYHAFTGDDVPVKDQILQKKAAILNDHMAGELANLYRLFLQLSPASGKVAPDAMKQAIGALLIYCPVYRYYGTSMPLTPEEAEAIDNILNHAEKDQPGLHIAIDALRNALLQQPDTRDEAYNEKAAHFYRRCMQFSGPLTAKGVEDTLMYTYARYIGHNDVGDAPDAFGITKDAFHKLMKERQDSWPLSLNTTSTHDTKRGEDVRARLAVLTDMPDEWQNLVKNWHKSHTADRQDDAPDAIDEYFVYQTLAGAWPMPGVRDNDFADRMDAYIVKMLREAKRHSSWSAPDMAYEDAAKSLVRGLIKEGSAFRNSFNSFHQQIAHHGVINSLSQLILKATCPGVPDIYQGTELWDMSLVDPDNRRPVDYDHRQELLSEEGMDTPLDTLWESRYDGRIKEWLTCQLLHLRKEHAALFSEGRYIPLKTEGNYKEHILAFARCQGKTWVITAIPLYLPSLCKRQGKEPEDLNWEDTRILLPAHAPTTLEHLLSKEKTNIKGVIFIHDIFKPLPFALLRSQALANDRSAGILLALSSLPSGFGIGDMGPEAWSFVRFLSRARQSYWQLLPLNPTEAGSGHSPYSSYSAMAGNPWLISPEGLAKDGLLLAEEVEAARLPQTDKADYKRAIEAKEQLFDVAYQRFIKGDNYKLVADFQTYCGKEADWLDDVSLYVAIKQHFVGEPWYRWSKSYKDREPDILAHFALEHQEAITKYKWLQFIFSRQWSALKQFAASSGIRMFGDIPFYTSYDSVDVWAHRDIFCLDDEGNMTGVAGVPPDYFSEDGQLWGMPTFNWEALRAQNYGWWAMRLRRNIDLFDLIRIDHFRAFQDYWQVPAGEQTARNGEWLPGPREAFFEAMRKQIGDLPFVAEDLGDKMEDVYILRAKLGLPGMKVLQFAWGDNMPQSVDVPHHHELNSIVYTGTHDNNTIAGWYGEESAKADHDRLHSYLGFSPRHGNIHEILSRLAYSSVARIAILPMQDVLGLGADARMNTPGVAAGNWAWRLMPGMATDEIAVKLRSWVELFDRV